MAISAFISDHGPSSNGCLIIKVTIPPRPARSTSYFKVFVHIDQNLYDASGCRSKLRNRDVIIKDLDLHIIFSRDPSLRSLPHLRVQSLTNPSHWQTDCITVSNEETTGFRAYRHPLPFFHRFITVTFTRRVRHPSPHLPYETWANITMIAFKMSSSSQEDLDLVCTFSLLNRVIQASGRRNYLTLMYCGNPYAFRLDRLPRRALLYAKRALFNHNRRPIVMLSARASQIGTKFVQKQQNTLVSVRLSCCPHMQTDLGNLHLPVLEVLDVERIDRKEDQESEKMLVFWGDLLNLIRRCPSLRHLRIDNFSFPRANTISAIPRLDTLILHNCTYLHGISDISATTKFMNLSQPRVLELCGTPQFSIAVPPVKHDGERVYPHSLIIDGIFPNHLAPDRLSGIEKVTLTSSKPLQHLLAMKSPNLGHLKIATQLTESDKLAIRKWAAGKVKGDMGSVDAHRTKPADTAYRTESWKSVKY